MHARLFFFPWIFPACMLFLDTAHLFIFHIFPQLRICSNLFQNLVWLFFHIICSINLSHQLFRQKINLGQYTCWLAYCRGRMVKASDLFPSRRQLCGFESRSRLYYFIIEIESYSFICYNTVSHASWAGQCQWHRSGPTVCLQSGRTKSLNLVWLR